MPILLLRVWVLLLAILLQLGSWRSEASSSTAASVAAPLTLGDFDAPDDGSEGLSMVDDSFGKDVVISSVPSCCSRAPGCCLYPWIEELPPGGPPVDAPFKPPRA